MPAISSEQAGLIMALEPPFPYILGPTPEPLVPSYVVVWRYLEQANVARQGCPIDLTNDKGKQHPSVLLWLGCLFVVKEGWTSDKLRDEALKSLLRRDGFVSLLETARNIAFHYEPSLIPHILDQAYATTGFLGWADQLHAAFVEALRKYAQTSRIPAGLRRINGQPRNRKR